MEEEYIIRKELQVYLDYLKYEKKLSENTYKSYKYNLKIFDIFFLNENLLSLKKDNIQDFLYNLKLKPKSKAHYLTVIKSFYLFCIKEKLLKENPCEGIKMPKLEKKLPNFLSVSEVDKLLDIPLEKEIDYRNKAMLEVLYATGLRISELTEITLSQIDFNECIIRVMGKGKKERITPLNSIAIKYLRLYIDNHRYKLLKNKQSNYVFLNNLGTNISRQGFFKILKELAKKANISKDISPHTLRHSFATHLLNNGADLRVIQEILGHENLVTTEIYAHLGNTKIKDDYKNHPHANF